MNVRARVPAGEKTEVGKNDAGIEARKGENVAPLKPAEPEPAVAAPKRKRSGRILLLGSVPVLLVLVGGYVWLTGGRYISTDNAYVQQTRVAISSDVSGKIADVLVRENQKVKAGDLLFRIDPASYKIALNAANAALAQARLQIEQLQASYRTAVAKLDAAESTAAIRHRSLSRSLDLSGKGFATPADVDAAQLAVTQADNDVALAKQSIDSARAALNGNPDLPVNQQPAVLTALANQAKAKLDLERTSARASVHR